MRRLRSQHPRITPVILVVALTSSISLFAWADAPDPVLPLNGTSVTNADGTITLTVQGGWEWPTHKSDCNKDRYAAGWAVDWNDPNQAGNLIRTTTTDVGVLAGNARNAKDNATHFRTVAPRCGTFNGRFNTGTWGPETHTYAAGTQTIAPCVVMYDIHGKTKPDSKDLLAGGPNGAGDNSVLKNASTPPGNGCFTFTFPSLTTNASRPVSLGNAIHDTAHLAGASAPTGTITFAAYGPDDATCSRPAAFGPANVSVSHGNGDYDSPSFEPTLPGVYRWVATYGGDAKNAAATSPCNSPNESVLIDVPQ